MALIFRGKTKCSLCVNIIMVGDEIVATSHFIADRNDPLWRLGSSVSVDQCNEYNLSKELFFISPKRDLQSNRFKIFVRSAQVIRKGNKPSRCLR